LYLTLITLGMSKHRRSVTLYYFQDGPKMFHSREERTVDEVAVSLNLEVHWINARESSSNPLLMTFNIAELPVLVVSVRTKQEALASNNYHTFTGEQLRNAARLKRALTTLREAR